MKKMNGFFPFLLLITSSAYAVVPPNLSGTIQGVVQPLAYSNTTHILSMPAATGSQNGYLTSGDWTTFNNKGPAITPGDISTSTTGVTVGSGTNSTVGPDVTVDIQTASGSQPGLLSAANWTTFNNKQSALSFGNLTEATSSVLTIGGGTGAVIGSGATIQVSQSTTSTSGYLSSTDWNTFNNKQAAGSYVLTTRSISTTAPLAGGGDLSADRTLSMPAAATAQNGYLTSTDWNTFNGKQAAGSYITALTGDATASGPGSSALTLATVNSNVGSFTNAAITVNGKGLITAASSGTIGDLTDVGTDGITITGGIGSVIGSGTAIVQHVADSSHNGYLALADFNQFSTDQLNGELEVAYNRTYTLALAIPYSGVINTLKIQTTSGTCTAAVNINGTPVTGISAVSVTSVLSTATASAANTFSANDKITLVITSATLANDLVYTLKVTKQ